MPKPEAYIPLTEACRKLHWTYWRARDALLVGRLRGRRDENGRYYVEVASVRQLMAASAATAAALGPDEAA